MQAAIAAHGHCLHYPREDNRSTPPADAAAGPRTLRGLPSALDVTLQGSWLHARGFQRALSRANLCAPRLYRAMRAARPLDGMLS